MGYVNWWEEYYAVREEDKQFDFHTKATKESGSWYVERAKQKARDRHFRKHHKVPKLGFTFSEEIGMIIANPSGLIKIAV